MIVRWENIIRDFLALPIIALLLTAVACSHDYLAENDADETMITVRITINLRNQASSDSRTLQDGGLDYDTSLQSIISADDVYVIFYNTDGTIAMVPDMGQLMGDTFAPARMLTAKLPLAGRTLSFRILANVASASSIGSTVEEVRNFLQTMAAQGKTDNDLIKALYADAFNAQGVWPLTATGGFLPMHSAMSAPITFTQDIALSTYLYRSLAKIGVEYVEDSTPFVIQQLMVVNQHQRASLLSPYQPASNINVQFSQPYVLDPALRASSTVYNWPTGETKLLEQIFVPEHINTGNSDSDLYLMFCGHFKNATHKCWYTIYFTDDGKLPASASNPSYNVIRNYSYIFRITKIEGPFIEVKLMVNPSWAEVHDLQLEE